MYDCYNMQNGKMLPTTDFLVGIGEMPDRPKTPTGRVRADHVADFLGYFIADEFPVSYSGGGLHVLGLLEEARTEIQSRFKYVAVFSATYEDVAIVGIPDVPDLLDFYAKVAPALLLQSDPRFWGTDTCGTWNRGRNW